MKVRAHAVNWHGEAVNVIALIKGRERYIWFFTDENRGETLRSLGRFAENEDLSFCWYDAAVLSQKVRETSKKVAAPLARINPTTLIYDLDKLEW